MGRSLRRISKEQFSSGSTIDGNRLDKAFADCVDRANDVPIADLRRRWVQSQIVAGWLPSPYSTQKSLPYMPGYNDNAAFWLAGTTPLHGVQNPWRTKGMNVGVASASIDPVANPATQDVMLWTTSLYLSKPAILQGVFLELLVDREFTCAFTKGGIDDNALGLTVMVDNPFSPEDRKQSNVAYHRVNFKAKSQWTTKQTPPALGLFTNMSPVHPEGIPLGICINDQNLNIALPRDSRIRLSVGIPFYSVANGWAPGALGPWASNRPTSVLTLLESVEV